MKVNRRTIAIGAAVAVLAAGGVGIAQAVDGDSDEQVTGPDAEKAKSAALKAVGGGSVTSVERDDDDGAAWEVEVARGNEQLEVRLDESYNEVGTGRDDEKPGQDDDDKGEGEDD
jgi:hypothetical protein